MVSHLATRDFKFILFFCSIIFLQNYGLAQNTGVWQPAFGINLGGLAKAAAYPQSWGLETTFSFFKNVHHGPTLNLVYSRDKALKDTPTEMQDWVCNTWMVTGGYTFQKYKLSGKRGHTKFTLLSGYYHTKADGLFVIYNPFYPSNFYRVPIKQSRGSYILEGKVSSYWPLSNTIGIDLGWIIGWANKVTNRSGWNLETLPVIGEHIGPVHFRFQLGIWFLPKAKS